MVSTESLFKELVFKTSRSGGKGGQNVNKVSTKVEINFDIRASLLFTEDQKVLLMSKLANRVNARGQLQVITEEDRSQLGNKRKGVDKLLKLLNGALQVSKPRKATKPSKNSVEKRLKLKNATAMKKINRRNDLWD